MPPLAARERGKCGAPGDSGCAENRCDLDAGKAMNDQAKRMTPLARMLATLNDPHPQPLPTRGRGVHRTCRSHRLYLIGTRSRMLSGGATQHLLAVETRRLCIVRSGSCLRWCRTGPPRLRTGLLTAFQAYFGGAATVPRRRGDDCGGVGRWQSYFAPGAATSCAFLTGSGERSPAHSVVPSGFILKLSSSATSNLDAQ